MVSGIERFVRPAIRELEPYEWEISTPALAARLAVPLDRILRFDTNTSPFPPSDLIAEVLASPPTDGDTVNEYPDASYGRLTHELARYTGFPVEQIVMGAGADEILDMIAKVFVGERDRAVVTAPTYAMYAIATELLGGTAIAVEDRKGYELNVEGLTRAAAGAKLLWICNPNNPTGNPRPLADLERLLGAVECPVVVDEAYFEFHGETAAGLVGPYPHLIVVRTLSKAFGLAGARIGYALASPEVARYLNTVRPPNSIAVLSVRLGTLALRRAEEMRRNVATIVAEREWLAGQLTGLGATVLPSVTNFLAFAIPGAKARARALLDEGIVVRDLTSRKRLESCLRVTVRTRAENERLVGALAAVESG
ncbi:MAG: histidinol-phosphate transaminase [Chloroflexi bacterium]|nr:histidinol-phosphate transaminase [Chloroflexota bacterium]